MPSVDSVPGRRLVRQRLWGAALDVPAEVVSWLVDVQAQEFGGAKWSVAQRLSDPRESAVDAAFNAGAILRTHLLRPTWHFVTPDDIRWLLALTGRRVHAKNATMYRRVGVDPPTVDRMYGTLQHELAGRHLGRPAIREALERAGIETATPVRFSYLLMHAELDGLICSGPRVGNQFSYALLDDVAAVSSTVVDIDAAHAELARRYVASRAPITAQDFATWSGLTLVSCRTALESQRGAALDTERIDGVEYWIAHDRVQPRPHRPRAFLLSIYDEIVAGYADRSAMVDPGVMPRLRLLGNDLTGVLFLDGRLAGTWKRTVAGKLLSVAVTSFGELESSDVAAVHDAKKRVAALAGLTLTQ